MDKETITLKIADLDNIIINALNKQYQSMQGPIAAQVRDDLIKNDIEPKTNKQNARKM